MQTTRRGQLLARLLELGRRGLIRDGTRYPRRAILEALLEVGQSRSQADRTVNALRDVARHGEPLPGVVVLAVGRGRGRRYGFEGLPTPGTAPDAQAAVSAPRQVSLNLTSPPRRPCPDEPIARDSGASASPATQRLRTETSKARLDIYFGDNLPILEGFQDQQFSLIYIDPPFNTGKTQARTRIRTVRDSEGGDRVGFLGQRYRTEKVGTASFADAFDDFCGFMAPRLEAAWRLLSPDGALFFHIDYREVHYCKVLLDQIFGRQAFTNELIWAYDYGGRSKKKWSAKHDNILWYVKDPKSYVFNFDEMDRIPYMAPGLVGKEKAARGKTPTDVWWHTIVPTNGKERTGYPTQKPLGILNRIIKVHTRPGDRVLDFFAGSGTTGEAALRLGRSCTLVDQNPEAMGVMAKRLAFAEPRFHGWEAAGER